MKKTLITLLALSGIAMGDYTVHDTTFNVNTTSTAYQKLNPTTSNLYVTGNTSWGSGADIQGLYVAADGGMSFNTAGVDVVIDYLYLETGLTVTNTDKAGAVGKVCFNYTTDTFPGLSINISDVNGAWLDINGNYGSVIDVSGMTTGSLYLNTAGALTLGTGGLNNGVTVYATVTDTANVRTLLSGTDLTGWTGTVVLQNADGTAYTGTDYIYETSAAGLSIVAAPTPGENVPEPTTATLSLLALAGLAARRRRK